MRDHFTAFTFDVDPASLATVREALPGWQINDIYGATVASLPCNWNPSHADLLVVGTRANLAETLGLCQFLAFTSSYSRDFRPVTADTAVGAGEFSSHADRLDAPLLVLVPPGQEAFARAAVEAGAHSCLPLPITTHDVSRMLRQARARAQASRRLLDLEERWQERDDLG